MPFALLCGGPHPRSPMKIFFHLDGLCPTEFRTVVGKKYCALCLCPRPANQRLTLQRFNASASQPLPRSPGGRDGCSRCSRCSGPQISPEENSPLKPAFRVFRVFRGCRSLLRISGFGLCIGAIRVYQWLKASELPSRLPVPQYRQASVDNAR